jgi:hypothetical protein
VIDQKPKCLLKQRKDDIPKLRAKEKSWHCDACGALLFADKKPPCPRTLLDNARAQAKLERERLHIED